MKELERYHRNFLARYAAIGEELKKGVDFAGVDKEVQRVLAELHAKQTHMLHPCIDAVLAGKGEMPTFDLGTWQEETDGDSTIDELLAAILAAHEKLAERISQLQPAGWSLQARHPWYGVRTLAWWLERNLGEMEGVVGVVGRL